MKWEDGDLGYIDRFEALEPLLGVQMGRVPEALIKPYITRFSKNVDN
jgi:hypothetical protein